MLEVTCPPPARTLPAVTSERPVRTQRYWDLLDFGVGRGVEIGPLHRMLVRREEADVRYLDVFDTETLRANYAQDPNVPVDQIPDIDYPLIADGRTRTMREAAGHDAPFDWVVASHVVEHVPDVIGWLAELAELVRDDGAVVLAVPDKRYTFDLHRPPTTVGAMLLAHESGDTSPSTRAVFDHFHQHVTAAAQSLWAGARPGGDARTYGMQRAWRDVGRRREGEYVDAHVWMFTPDLFATQLRDLRRSGLSSWYVEELVPTPRHDLEFRVRLRRIPRSVDATLDPPDEVVPDDERPFWLQDADAAAAEIAQLQRTVRRQRRRIRRQQKELAAVRSSVRWRVGNAVVGPVSRVVSGVRRRRADA